MERIAVYAGSFCPFTKGHEDIVAKALPLFDKLIIAIGYNPDKRDVFDEFERQMWVKDIYKDNPKIHVLSYSELTVELCRLYQARYLIRGVRNARDFDAEQELAEINKRLAPEIETVSSSPLLNCGWFPPPWCVSCGATAKTILPLFPTNYLKNNLL